MTIVEELLNIEDTLKKQEALIADIKATVYSPFQSEEMKLKFIKKAIAEAGY